MRKPKKEESVTQKNFKICVICDRPHKAKTETCNTCNRKKKALNQKLKYKGINYKHGFSNSKIVYLKQIYKVDDIIDYLMEDVRRCFMTGHSTKKERNELKKEIKRDNCEQKHHDFEKWTECIPAYIKQFMSIHPLKEFLTLSGKKSDPNIHYICKKCGEEQAQLYSEMLNNKSHNCKSNRSSGEAIVEHYLSQYFSIKRQRETLQCINPITNRVMPYDIEIPELKVIVEIQGQQHLEFIPYFHGTIENFHYQQRKDSYKKRFAEKCGYTVIYIYYDELKNGTFKNKFKDLGIM